MKTLLLNADHRPLKTICWKRAILLTLDGRAAVVSSYKRVVRSPSFSISVPAVLSLKSYVNYRPRFGGPKLRLVASRDMWLCQYCGEQCTTSNATKDHVVPISYFKSGKAKGNPNTWENVVLACKPCNGRKKNRRPEEAGMTLKKIPQAPKTSFLIDGEIPQEWTPYV